MPNSKTLLAAHNSPIELLSYENLLDLTTDKAKLVAALEMALPYVGNVVAHRVVKKVLEEVK